MKRASYAQVARGGSVEAKAAVLWISDAPPPPNVLEALGGGQDLRIVKPGESLAPHAGAAQAAIVCPSGAAMDFRRVSMILDELERTALVALVLAPAGGTSLMPLLNRSGQFSVAPADAPGEAIAGQLSALLQLQPALKNLQNELNQVRTFGRDIGATFDQFDEEMRLAARLQRDFLPKKLPAVGRLSFSVLFRPATWVSGDIYDVMRLDETHTGFYVADAVGHGLPAALLTMFIKRALPTKRVSGNSYEIVSPESAIAELNASICEQNLSSCQFCTAVYFVADSQTLEMTFARGGHPQPLLLGADGRTRELDSNGGLLGIFPEETFELGRVSLSPGDRVIVFSDGAEGVFRTEGTSGREDLLDAIERYRHLSVEDMMLELTGLIDSQQGSLHPEDDVTVLAMDVAK